jgi:hypothetical protein
MSLSGIGKTSICGERIFSRSSPSDGIFLTCPKPLTRHFSFPPCRAYLNTVARSLSMVQLILILETHSHPVRENNTKNSVIHRVCRLDCLFQPFNLSTREGTDMEEMISGDASKVHTYMVFDLLQRLRRFLLANFAPCVSLATTNNDTF